MTNYNERLEEVLRGIAIRGAGKKQDDDYVSDAKQAITSLTKELVAEAKSKVGKSKSAVILSRVDFSTSAIDQFEQNLLKALEEV